MEWISVYEKLPPLEEYVLVIVPNEQGGYRTIASKHMDDEGWHFQSSFLKGSKPSHWMPLPEPPKQ